MKNTLFLLSLILSACGQNSGSDRSGPGPRQNADVIANPNRHNVLVIDDGFDLNHPVFSNKIVARYRLRCSDSNEILFNGDDNFERQKKLFIDYLALEENNCVLSNSLPFQPTRALEAIQSKRAEWNSALMNKSIEETYRGREAEAQSIFSIVTDEGRYHGTNTAGLIAYQNDNVNLIVLQLELASPQSATTKSRRNPSCPTQSDIDFTARLFNDPDVRKAYAKAPLATVSGQDEAIQRLIEKHKIDLVNKSYGLLPLASIQRRLDDAGCGVDFSPIFQARGQLLASRRSVESQLNSTARSPLVFQAAGNESLSINSVSESWDCTTNQDNVLLIGGVTHEFDLANWSNYGRCVEMFAVGDRVITPAPLDFLGLSSGTSFSAPMALRYASIISSKNDSPEVIKEKLLGELDGQRNLSDQHFPKEIVYHVPDKISSYGLVDKRVVKAKLQLKDSLIDKKRIPPLLRHLF